MARVEDTLTRSSTLQHLSAKRLVFALSVVLRTMTTWWQYSTHRVRQASLVVTDIYGEYFIAELIEAQNEENKALVAEVDGRAVGMMCLTSNVDVNVLAQCFHLDPYDNLLKPNIMSRVRDHARSVLDGALQHA
eukprot:2512086-Amphidinium_carterae.1